MIREHLQKLQIDIRNFEKYYWIYDVSAPNFENFAPRIITSFRLIIFLVVLLNTLLIARKRFSILDKHSLKIALSLDMDFVQNLAFQVIISECNK